MSLLLLVKDCELLRTGLAIVHDVGVLAREFVSFEVAHEFKEVGSRQRKGGIRFWLPVRCYLAPIMALIMTMIFMLVLMLVPFSISIHRVSSSLVS